MLAIIKPQVTKFTKTIMNRKMKLARAYFTGSTGTSGLQSSV
jgi:hypothetical protein